MTTGTEKRIITIYIINDDQYTDFDVSLPDNLEDYLYEDLSETASSIGKEIAQNHSGEKELQVEITLEYSKDYDWYYGCYEYDMKHSYKVISENETDYWKNYDEKSTKV
jgi:hypothetical protein